MDRYSESEESDEEMLLNLSSDGTVAADSDSEEFCEDLIHALKSNDHEECTEIDTTSDKSNEDEKRHGKSKGSAIDEHQKSALSATSSDGTGKKCKIYKCDRPNCNAIFYKPSHIKEHQNVHDGKRTYVCNEVDCNKSYFKWDKLRSHLISQHRINVDKRTYLGSELPPRVKEEKPQKKHTCPYEGCKAEFARPWRLTAHLCRHTGEKPYRCKVSGCGRAYIKAEHLYRHFTVSHDPGPTVMKEFMCKEAGCMKVYKTLANLKKHCKILHSGNADKTHPYKCSHCSLRFTTLNRLRGHEYTHTSIPPYKCSECPKSFTDISLWKKHCRSHKKFTCPVPDCGEFFPNFNVFKEHRNNAHAPSVACSSCDRKFKSKLSLSNHMRVHLKPRERNLFECLHQDCQKFYKKKSNLDHHVRVTHEGKKFPCSFPGCERKLATKQKLKEHMKLHDPNHPPPERKSTVRRQRKDAGLSKRAMAVIMSGADVPYEIEKELLEEDRMILGLASEQENDTSDLGSGDELGKSGDLVKTVVGEQIEPVKYDKCEYLCVSSEPAKESTTKDESSGSGHFSRYFNSVGKPANTEGSDVISDISVCLKAVEAPLCIENTGSETALHANLKREK